jgi:hypothetical protein
VIPDNYVRKIPDAPEFKGLPVLQKRAEVEVGVEVCGFLCSFWSAVTGIAISQRMLNDFAALSGRLRSDFAVIVERYHKGC